MPKRVICIQGPTASGKSELAERIACELDGEIVSADSMQVYRGMDIGTAKVSEQNRGVPYHCIDLLEPGQPYSAALFQRDARHAIEDIWRRGKRAVLVGGTGLYVRAVLDRMDFAAGEQEGNEIRAAYEKLAHEQGAQAVYDLLTRRDPASAALIHPNNTRRVIRALEMHDEGESYAQRKERFKSLPPYYESVKIGLNVERDLLYQRINARVDKMFAQGLVDEVKGLLEQGFRSGLTAPQAIGYKEIVAALEGDISLDQAAEQIKQATRRYAKRQFTWLKSDAAIQWIDASADITDEVVCSSLALIGARA